MGKMTNLLLKYPYFALFVSSIWGHFIFWAVSGGPKCSEPRTAQAETRQALSFIFDDHAERAILSPVGVLSGDLVRLPACDKLSGVPASHP
eukprot:3017468-Amphidinium_carterae.1